MARVETWFNQDLQKAVTVHYLDGNVFSADIQGNVVGVNVFNGGETATLAGTVVGNIIRSDGVTVSLEGTLSGNRASVILPSEAYEVPGVISVIIKLRGSDTTTTLCAVVANVYLASTDMVITPGIDIQQTIAELIATINEAIESIPADYSELSNYVYGKDIIDHESIVEGKWVDYRNGQVKNDTDPNPFFVTGLIPVTAYDVLYVTGGTSGSQVAFYDGEEHYVTGKITNDGNLFTVPDNTDIAYVRWCSLVANKDAASIRRILHQSDYEWAYDFSAGKTLVKYFIDGQYVHFYDGTTGEEPSTCATDYIKIAPSTVLRVTGGADGMSQIAYYDSNFTYVTGAVTGAYDTILVPDDQNIAYFRWCTTIANKPSASVKRLAMDVDDKWLFDFTTGANLIHATVFDYYVHYYNGELAYNSDFFTTDYIRVLPSTSLLVSGGVSGAQIAYYNENKQYVTGAQTDTGSSIVVPDDVSIAYFRWCTEKTNLATASIGVNLGASSKTGIIVSASGDGDYTNLSDAVANATNGAIIYVRKGTYDNEVVRAWGKNITIIGEDKYQTIIKNGYNDYERPPLEMCIGCLENLTLYQYDSGATPGQYGGGYGLHIEHNSMTNGTFTARNVVFKSDLTSGAGIGLRPGCYAYFESCEFWSRDWAGVFYHDCATGAVGVQNIIFDGCSFMTANYTASIIVNSQRWEGSTVYNTFRNCVVANESGTTPVVEATNATQHSGGATSPIGDFYELVNFFKGYLSYGNNVDGLNYYESSDVDITPLADGLAIVSDGNTHPAITTGQFVFVMNHNTLAEGLYTAKGNIAANAALSTNNLDADTSGGLNALYSNITGKFGTNYGSTSNPVTSLNDLPINGAGYAVLDASISPTGAALTCSFIKSGTINNNRYNVLVKRISSNANEQIYFGSMYDGTFLGWQQLALNGNITPYNLGTFNDMASLKTALLNYAASQPETSVRYIKFYPNFTDEDAGFYAAAYGERIGEINIRNSTRFSCIITFQNGTTTRMACNNGTWYVDKFAYNSKTTFTLTTKSGFTFVGTAYKEGNTVTITGGLTFTATTDTSFSAVFTIPSGYRPSHQVNFPAFDNINVKQMNGAIDASTGNAYIYRDYNTSISEMNFTIVYTV